MMTAGLRWLLPGLLLVSLPTGTFADGSSLAPAIARFQQVDARLYRGGQPDAAGFERLRQLGIRTIVNLRHTDDERELVESMGFRYVALPTHLRPFGVGGGLRDEVVQRFFELVDDPANGPIYVHCRRGADRTGTLVAMYRIARQGWSVDAAYDEARASGMRWWHYSVKGFLEDFGAPVAPPHSITAPLPAAP
jgi:tyrosine-protein phosphatase SIW14